MSVVAQKPNRLNVTDTADLRRINSIKDVLQCAGHSVDIVFYPWSYSLFSVPNVHVKHLRNLLEKDYDIVYGNGHGGTFFSLLGALTTKPLIFDMHGGTFEELMQAREDRGFSFLLSYTRNVIPRFLNTHLSDKVLCVSKRMMSYLKKKGVRSSKLFYLTNGIDLNRLQPVDSFESRRIREGFEDDFVFGYIGSFVKYQGVENLICAAESLDEKGLSFLMVGSTNNIKKNIRFVGRVPFSQIGNYYSACDAFVLPRPSHISTEIAAPTKFSEYCAYGKPILATDVGDAADLVRKYNCGIVVRDNQPSSLREGLLRMKRMPERELQEMGKNARRLAAQEFDWTKIMAPFLEEIEGMI